MTYEKPNWSAVTKSPIKIEVLKNGTIINELFFKEKEFITIGRLNDCDIILEHESISRLHCIIQFAKDQKAFIYDNNSTHGTFVNKHKIDPRKYIPLAPGCVLKFGFSTRLYIFEPDVKIESVKITNPKQVIINWIKGNGIEFQLEDLITINHVDGFYKCGFEYSDDDMSLSALETSENREEAENLCLQSICEQLVDLGEISLKKPKVLLEERPDEYLDRTIVTPKKTQTYTYKDLLLQEQNLINEIESLEKNTLQIETGNLENSDELDKYMHELETKQNEQDQIDRINLIEEKKKELGNVKKMIKLIKPM